MTKKEGKPSLVERTLKRLQAGPGTQDDWIQGWRELASLSDRVHPKDYARAMLLLDQADEYFAKDDWAGFEGVQTQFRELVPTESQKKAMDPRGQC